MVYRVFVDDNFHYMDEDERELVGEFATYDEALAACQAIVDRFLVAQHRPGMASEELFSGYRTFGEDPFIVGPKLEHSEPFSAWKYAERRCGELCADGDIG
jgi:hypothetical protein